MIKLTRLRQNTPFILNPDHIERIDTHVDTVVRLTTGAEYVVNETGEDIVRMTIEYRARVIASAGALAVGNADPVEAPAAPAVTEPVTEPEPDTEPETDIAGDDVVAEAPEDDQEVAS